MVWLLHGFFSEGAFKHSQTAVVMKKAQSRRHQLTVPIRACHYHPGGSRSDCSGAHKGQSARGSTGVVADLTAGTAGNVRHCTIDNDGSRDKGVFLKARSCCPFYCQ